MPAGFFFHFTIGAVFLPHVLYSALYCTMISAWSILGFGVPSQFSFLIELNYW